MADPTNDSVIGAYRRWAPIYDAVFGRIFRTGRAAAAERVNAHRGRLLEVGVGTGVGLPLYAPHLTVTGIDLSPDMLAIARQRVAREGLANVEAVEEMDAGAMTFEDAGFDVVVAMYVITVVPDPAMVLDEMLRVAKPGADLYVINHFAAQGSGPRAKVERRLAHFGSRLGWRPDFDKALVTRHPGLRLVDDIALPPARLFSMLHFKKDA